MSLEQRHRTPNSGETPEGEERALNSSTTTETYRIPGSADQEQYEESTYDPNKQRGKRRGLRLIGASAALAVILAGGGYALSRGGENVDAKAPPVATAPAAPGETAPSTGGAEILNNLTLANFPFEIDGKKYEGFDAFKEALAIDAGDYTEYNITDAHPELAEDGERATTEVVSLINQWLNYDITTIEGVAPEIMDKYEYTRSDGASYVGESALKREFVDTAFERLLFEKTDLDGAKYPTSFIDDIRTIAAKVQSLREFTKGEANPYKGEFVIVDPAEVIIGGKHLDRPGVTVGSEVIVQYKDNATQNTVGESPNYSAPIGLENPYIWSIALDSSGTSKAGQYEHTDRAGEFGPYWRIAKLTNTPKKTM